MATIGRKADHIYLRSLPLLRILADADKYRLIRRLQIPAYRRCMDYLVSNVSQIEIASRAIFHDETTKFDPALGLPQVLRQTLLVIEEAHKHSEFKTRSLSTAFRDLK
jgi:hypothetical protein